MKHIRTAVRQSADGHRMVTIHEPHSLAVLRFYIVLDHLVPTGPDGATKAAPANWVIV